MSAIKFTGTLQYKKEAEENKNNYMGKKWKKTLKVTQPCKLGS